MERQRIEQARQWAEDFLADQKDPASAYAPDDKIINRASLHEALCTLALAAMPVVVKWEDDELRLGPFLAFVYGKQGNWYFQVNISTKDFSGSPISVVLRYSERFPRKKAAKAAAKEALLGLLRGEK